MTLRTLRIAWIALAFAAGGLLLVATPTGAVAGPTFTVNVAGTDVSDAALDGVCETAAGNGECSLRAAIQETNAAGGGTILFNIPGAATPGGPHSIVVDYGSPNGDLPAITGTTIIDATSEPGYVDRPLVYLQAVGSPPGGSVGLTINGDGSEVHGLAIGGFKAAHIWVEDADDVVIQDNHIGVDAVGNTPLPQTPCPCGASDGHGHALFTFNAMRVSVIDNVVGGAARDGIHVRAWPEAAIDPIVQGNLVGVGKDGSSDVGNGNDGIELAFAYDGLIGGHGDGEENVVSHNGWQGIYVHGGGGSDVQILGNIVGLGAEGSTPLGTGSNGIYLDAINTAKVGDGQPGGGNVVGLATFDGIYLGGTSANVEVKGNLIGTDATGIVDRGNGRHGIQALGTGHLIGGTGFLDLNVFAFNGDAPGENGIRIEGGTTMSILGNHVGLIDHGATGAGNDGCGIYLSGSHDIRIGQATAGNVVADNGDGGICVQNNSDRAIVQGNIVGTDPTQTLDLGNGFQGIYVGSGSDDFQVGGPDLGDGNVVAYAGVSGITLWNANGAGVGTATIQGNSIGVDSAGVRPLPNTGSGIMVWEGTRDIDITDNHIAHNGGGSWNCASGAGIVMCETSGTTASTIQRLDIRKNSIHDNNGPGIDLGGSNNAPSLAGPTANDPGDTDTGPNGLVNFPAINTATWNGGANTISYDLSLDYDTTASPGGVVVDFYLSRWGDSGNTACANVPGGSAIRGEGGTWINSIMVTGGGPHTGTLAAPNAWVRGYTLTTTLTTDQGTSEFSECWQLGDVFNVGSLSDTADFSTADGVCDIDNSVGDGPCTLRAAIQEASVDTAPSTIRFSLGGTISIGTSLPVLSYAALIDGASAPGYTGTSPLVELTDNPGGVATGLATSGHDLGRIHALSITGFARGMLLYGDQTAITDNFIGLTRTAAVSGNTLEGIRLPSSTPPSSDWHIAGNTIAGNGGDGILWLDGTGDIVGNNIGIKPNGIAAGNGGHGIYVQAGSPRIGDQHGLGNVIANNGFAAAGHGVYSSGTSSITVEGNTLGLSRDHSTRHTNSVTAMRLDNAPNAVIQDNVMGCGGWCVQLTGAASTGQVIKNNWMGMTPAGDIHRPTNDGFRIGTNHPGGILLGGVDAGNVIVGGTGGYAVDISSGTGSTLRSNFIGVSPRLSSDGLAGPGSTGISVSNGADTTTIGGTGDGEGNVIGDLNRGIYVTSGTAAVVGNVLGNTASEGIYMQTAGGGTVRNNDIGVTPTGLDWPNAGSGVLLQAGTFTVGGSPGEGNTILNSAVAGVNVWFSGTGCIDDNTIGLDELDGPRPNGKGIWVQPTAGTGLQIGNCATTPSLNVISGNSVRGIEIDAPDVAVDGNKIGVSADGTAAAGNGGDGIRILAGGDNVQVANNVISANGLNGIHTAAEGGTFLGNYIGTNAAGNAALGNAFDGIEVGGSSGTIDIGDGTPGGRNIISGNGDHGIQIVGPVVDVAVKGNYFGLDSSAGCGANAGSTCAFGNGRSGIRSDDGATGTLSILDNRIGNSARWAMYLTGANIAGQGTISGNVVGAGANGEAQPNGWQPVGGEPADGSGPLGYGGIFVNNGPYLVTDNEVVWTKGPGIRTGGSARAVVISDNDVGIGWTGSAWEGRGNSDHGIFVTDDLLVDILDNNVGSNGGHGIVVQSTTGAQQTLQPLVAGNFVGISPADGALPNLGHGIFILHVGGADIFDNVVSDNGADGIHVANLCPGSNAAPELSGNVVGLDTSGLTGGEHGNGESGIEVVCSRGSTIGGIAAGDANVIGDNGGLGVFVHDTAVPAAGAHSFIGNRIGVDAAGDVAGNLEGGVKYLNGRSVYIDGRTVRNVVSANGGHGIHLENIAGTSDVRGTFIGVNPDGLGANNGDAVLDAGEYSNTGHGLYMVNAGGNIGYSDTGADGIVGGPDFVDGNLIAGNLGDGIHLVDGTHSGGVVYGNVVGLDINGAALGNNGHGLVSDSWWDIGCDCGSTAAPHTIADSGNIFSANGGHGIFIHGSTPLETIFGGNGIGVDPTGQLDRGNGGSGVRMDDVEFFDYPQWEWGVISGNAEYGIHLRSAGGQVDANPFLYGTIIGLASDGLTPVPNDLGGILFEDIASGDFGDDNAGKGLVVSGNGGHGIWLTGTSDGDVDTSFRFYGNRIGTDITGLVAVGNAGDGIRNDNVDDVAVGAVLGDRQVISGNGGDGLVFRPGATGTVQFNHIGLDADGMGALPNANNGVLIDAAIVDVGSGGQNVISGNGEHGVVIVNVATYSDVHGNIIGLAADGLTARGNGFDGVFIGNSGGNIDVGEALAANTISGNGASGIYMGTGAGGTLYAYGNVIGLDVSATQAVGNGGTGIYVTGEDATIGGAGPGTGNTIAGNLHHGVWIDGAGSAINAYVRNNRIGTNGYDDALGNGWSGVHFAGLVDGEMGGTDPSVGNTIRFNAEDGVSIEGTAAAHPHINILGNSIADNGGLGIDLWDNDALDLSADDDDLDEGPNGVMNTANLVVPIIGSIWDPFDVEVDLEGPPGADLWIELFATPLCDLTGAGEGQHIISGQRQLVPANGELAFLTTENHPSAFPGPYYLTATVTNDLGGEGTSEFSSCAFVDRAFPVATFVVDSIGDEPDAQTGDDVCQTASGSCTLRAAIQTVNTNQASTASQRITFGIPGTGPHIITVSTLLPALDPVHPGGVAIDATSQPGWGGTPIVELTGAQTAGLSAGLTIGAVGAHNGHASEIRGLAIYDFAGDGILVYGDDSIIADNVIGARPGATSASAFQTNGINIAAYDVLVQRNTIVGHSGHGIKIGNDWAENFVFGNHIGTDGLGTPGLGNGGHGIFLNGADDNFIGGSRAGQSNVIADNAGAGIHFAANADGNILHGNLIGIDRAGRAIGNAVGVDLVSGSDTLIGGLLTGQGNVIANNVGYGIDIPSNSLYNVIEGNRIGTTNSGLAAAPNTGGSVKVGSPADIRGNVIGGSPTHGLELIGAAGGSVVESNIIGLGADGVTPIPNNGDGIHAATQGTPATGALIGGPQVGNIIGSNTGHGIYITGDVSNPATMIEIVGNRIGTDRNGAAKGNGGNGIMLDMDMQDIDVGHIGPGEGNVIAYNTGYGIQVGANTIDGLRVRGNSIHSNAAGGYDGPDNTQGPVPALTEAIKGSVHLAGTMVAGTYDIDVYASPACPAQGQTFLGTLAVTNAGTEPFAFESGIDIPAGWGITAHATAATGSTSPGSGCLPLTVPAVPCTLTSADPACAVANFRITSADVTQVADARVPIPLAVVATTASGAPVSFLPADVVWSVSHGSQVGEAAGAGYFVGSVFHPSPKPSGGTPFLIKAELQAATPISDTMQVTMNAGPLAMMGVSPANAVTSPGQTVSLVTAFRDAFLNPVGAPTSVEWTLQGPGTLKDKSAAGAKFTAPAGLETEQVSIVTARALGTPIGTRAVFITPAQTTEALTDFRLGAVLTQDAVKATGVSTYTAGIGAAPPGAILDIVAPPGETDDELLVGAKIGIDQQSDRLSIRIKTQLAKQQTVPEELDTIHFEQTTGADPTQVPLVFLEIRATRHLPGTGAPEDLLGNELNNVLGTSVITFRIPVDRLGLGGTATDVVLVHEYSNGGFVATPLTATRVGTSPDGRFGIFQLQTDTYSAFAIVGKALTVPASPVGGGGGGGAPAVVANTRLRIEIPIDDPIFERVDVDFLTTFGQMAPVATFDPSQPPAGSATLPDAVRVLRFIEVHSTQGDVESATFHVAMPIEDIQDPDHLVILHLRDGVWVAESRLAVEQHGGFYVGLATASCCSLFAVVEDSQAPLLFAILPEGEVSGTVHVAIDADDNIGIDRAEVRLDGKLIAVLHDVPVELPIHTPQFSNGRHLLRVQVFDTAGHSDSTSQVLVLQNTGFGGALIGQSIEVTKALIPAAGAIVLALLVLVGFFFIMQRTGLTISQSAPLLPSRPRSAGRETWIQVQGGEGRHKVPQRATPVATRPLRSATPSSGQASVAGPPAHGRGKPPTGSKRSPSSDHRRP